MRQNQTTYFNDGSIFYSTGQSRLFGASVQRADPPGSPAAVNLFTAAADAGNDMVSYQPGKLFYTKDLVPKALEMAMLFLKQASDHHKLFAMTHLGTIHLNNKISRQDHPKAAPLPGKRLLAEGNPR